MAGESESEWVSRELGEGLTLWKRRQGNAFEWELHNESMHRCVFEADFEKSVNVQLFRDGLPVPYLVLKTEVNPFERKEVARAQPKSPSEKWKFKTGWGFELSEPSEEILKGLMAKLVALPNQGRAKIEQQVQEESRSRCADLDPSSPLQSILKACGSDGRVSFVDPEFPPADRSLFIRTRSYRARPVQWRRPQNFLLPPTAAPSQTASPVCVPPKGAWANDVQQGFLGNSWLISAMAMLTERPDVLQRAFLSGPRHANGGAEKAQSAGVHRFRLTKMGVPVEITIDDYLPCFPGSTQMYCRGADGSVWAALLEKAVAKLHGCYSILKGGSCHEALGDISGDPVTCFLLPGGGDFGAPSGSEKLRPEEAWKLVQRAKLQGCVVCAATVGEELFEEVDFGAVEASGLLPGRAYSVVAGVEVKRGHGGEVVRLLRMRCGWGELEWKGPWGEGSSEWTDDLRRQAGGPALVALQRREGGDQHPPPPLPDSDGEFFLSLTDFCNHFATLSVVWSLDWAPSLLSASGPGKIPSPQPSLREGGVHRFRTRFERGESRGQNSNQSGSSPSAEAFVRAAEGLQFSVSGKAKTRLFLSVQQEDERTFASAEKRPNLDIGLAVISLTDIPKSAVDLQPIAWTVGVMGRECSLETSLPPGHYLALPLTTGCALPRPPDALVQGTGNNEKGKGNQNRASILTPASPQAQSAEGGKASRSVPSLSPSAEAAFRAACERFAVSRVAASGVNNATPPTPLQLSPEEFRALREKATNSPASPLKSALKSEKDNTEAVSFREALLWFQELAREGGEEAAISALERLGFDRDLFSVVTRPITVSLFSERAVTAAPLAPPEGLAEKVWTALALREGKRRDAAQPLVVYALHCKAAMTFTYVVRSNLDHDAEATLVVQRARNMVSHAHPAMSVRRFIRAKQAECFVHLQALRSALTYTAGWDLQFRILKPRQRKSVLQQGEEGGLREALN
uniref:Calpain catalytic domain-containing protein n=1 Tax=Chromera velia CCMP2878 TaxID=1169474 RepID=A0A0G4I4L0_9ALVE|eukprot:Cvel_10891.t1-p1 / transcript=Cvel_10891.t1 / gene=Cvel_10891 / organism=Chromera_velia_CCMP2878 / gene_product=Calpain-D, putative / transcript_product=Calpain-D, putative / location=Cvel_scaffold668:470-4180(+) / protein_length=969 / sequence_SO=supercontig / SO=protein_coding / is_pseudo=false